MSMLTLTLAGKSIAISIEAISSVVVERVNDPEPYRIVMYMRAAPAAIASYSFNVDEVSARHILDAAGLKQLALPTEIK